VTPRGRFSPSLGLWSLAALALGLLLGLLGKLGDVELIRTLADVVQPAGTVWINALQMTVIPLVVTQLLAAIVRPGGAGAVGRLGGRAVVLFVTMLVGAGLLTVLLTSPILAHYHVAPEVVSALHVESIPEAALAAARRGTATFGDWLGNLLPRNPFEAAARGDILQILAVTILGGMAVGRLPAETRDPLARLIRGLADAMMILVSWILWGTPIGVFALILGLSLEAGLGAVNLLGWYIVVVCGLLIFATVLLYPLTVALGRTSLRQFARSAAPGQLVAVGTQSSLASLPALIEGGRTHMRLPEHATGFLLPLCVATYKLNQGISPLFKLLLLAHFFGIPLGAGDIATFILLSTLLSFGVPGVPRGGGFTTLPLFLALGIPIEGVVIVEAVKTIPDFFMTLLNVTADMSAATVLTRDSRLPGSVPVGAAPSAEGQVALPADA
jgi:proton glutamate symport protein